jgi:exodeoxyribonuclease V alpha subunit
MHKIQLTSANIINNFTGMEAGLVRTLMRLEGGRDAPVLLAAALACQAANGGHACIDLARLAAKPLAEEAVSPEDRITCPALEDWLKRLQASLLVGTPEQWRPLILDRGHFLYLQRFHHYEQAIAGHLKRIEAGRPVGEISLTTLSERLPHYFSDMPPGEIDWQKAAAVIALWRRLCVISGAPGTGKTTTAAKIIGLLIDVCGSPSLRFALCAPTGKAAARLSQALRAAAENLPGGTEARKRFPTEASTIHRLLAFSRQGFRFNAANPLPADVVVVDEASMIDLALMAQLLEAVPPDARLIILGDHHQLSSVEAGAVMGDICQDARPTLQAPDLRAAFHDLGMEPGISAMNPPDRKAPHPGPLSDNVVVLERNYRFDTGKGIGRLIRAVNVGNLPMVREALSAAEPEIQWLRSPLAATARHRLQQSLTEGYRPLFEAETLDQALEALVHFMVLGAVIRGPWGTEQLNLWIESLLRQAGLIEGLNHWYPGRPVMIRRNDYRAGLFNGDIGIVWPERKQKPSERRVWFRMPDGQIRAFDPQQLPEHQTALALTIHKSQGSEYRHVVLALPEKDSPVLTRELLYTGLSRARQEILLVAGESILDLTVSRRIDRASGLKSALDKEPQSAAGDGPQPDAEGA